MEDKQKYILEGLPKKASDRHLQLVELIYAELMRTKENNPTKIDNVDLATTIPEQPVPETLRILPINRKGTKDLTETMQESLADLRQYFLPYDTPITQYTNEIMDTQRQLTQLPIGIDRKPLRLKKKASFNSLAKAVKERDSYRLPAVMMHCGLTFPEEPVIENLLMLQYFKEAVLSSIRLEKGILVTMSDSLQPETPVPGRFDIGINIMHISAKKIGPLQIPFTNRHPTALKVGERMVLTYDLLLESLRALQQTVLSIHSYAPLADAIAAYRS